MVSWENIEEILRQSNNISAVVRIVLAMICGGVLGLERGKANQPAGMRTYMLVCVGSAFVMMTGQYCFQYFENGDPARLGAQVVSGIGFLGAGSIVSIKTRVKGLTTAAGLWAAASIGLGIGIGFYGGAVITTAAAYLIISKFRSLENHFTGNDTWQQLYIQLETVDKFPEILKSLENMGLVMGDVQLSKSKSKGHPAAVIALKNPARKSEDEIMNCLTKQEGILSFSFL